MWKNIFLTGFGVFLENWLDRRRDRKRMEPSPRKGIHPLLAIGGLVFGALVGVMVGFLYSPKNRSYNTPLE